LSSRAERFDASPWHAERWRAELVAVWAFAARSLLMASRNVFFFFELLFWPVVGVLSIGLMARFLALDAPQTSFVLTGTIALSVIQVCQLEVAYAVLYDVWSKSMKHQFLAPIGVRHLTTGSWVVGVVRGLLVLVLLSVLAWWSFGFNVLAAGWGGLAVFLLGCFLTAWVVGVAVCTLVMYFGSRAEASAWASVNLVLVLAGIYYPISILPPPVAALASAVPLTYFLDAYRSHYGFALEFAHPIATGLALSAVYLALSHWSLVFAVQRARRSGQLLKMSG
jgi:ABC-2 type transport system permease protein